MNHKKSVDSSVGPWVITDFSTGIFHSLFPLGFLVGILACPVASGKAVQKELALNTEKKIIQKAIRLFQTQKPKNVNQGQALLHKLIRRHPGDTHKNAVIWFNLANSDYYQGKFSL